MPERTDEEIQGAGLVFSLKATLKDEESLERSILGGFASLDAFDNVMPKPKEVDYGEILDFDMIHYGPLHR